MHNQPCPRIRSPSKGLTSTKSALAECIQSKISGHDEMVPRDYTSVAGVCCIRPTSPSSDPGDGSQHGLARRSGLSARLRRLPHGPEPQIWEEVWYAASRGLLGLKVSRYTTCAAQRRKGSRGLATCASPAYVPHLQLAFVEALMTVAFSCRSRLEKSMSAPRSREPPESLALHKSSTDQRESSRPLCTSRTIVSDWPS
ncbi:uncharacterized protein M421DRAFT_375821 [Didymella exigua CBS 183.55]|uniref:Uncharacterized protein n=1 Tax=Didymella exigua CBS 183.55 TaxID=1150837 RepID=A0A6A5RT27_9PLEO|nr:uncharacterized protein M421DRAFT_375821 [Didymella exigua CBS 183.55]KAF1930510.1 hypothetical protein M421DRAFT_375821 [Didymella exigua CBS 183.55]